MTVRLDKGHHPFKPGGCLVEVVSMLFGRKFALTENGVVADWEWRGKTDSPRCVSPTVARACQLVNDALPEPERQRLAVLIPRIMRARTMDPDVERRIAIRLGLWAARSVEDHIRPAVLERFQRALELSEARLWDEDGELDDNHWEPDWMAGCHAAAQAATMPTGALHGAVTTLKREGDDLVLWLDALLDAWEKACAEEGASIYDPQGDYPPDEEVQAVIDAILSPG